MRVFYIFNLKSEFRYLYQDHPYSLFQMLKKIYSLEEKELLYGKSLFCQLIHSFDKEKLDSDLFIKLHQEMPYSKKENIHYMNNLYKNEVSRLEIKKTYMRLEIENQSSTFFDIIKELDLNLFVCDFKNLDYFFIIHGKNSCLSA